MCIRDRGHLASFISLLVMRQGRGSEATEAVFRQAKEPLHTGVRTGCHYLISLSVCTCVTLNSSFLLIATAVRGRFPQTRYLWKRTSMGERVGRVFSHVVSRWSRSPGCCGFRCVFRVGCFFSSSFSDFFFLGMHTACCKYEAALPHFPLY